MGKRLKQKVDEVEANIQRLYNNLGNIAFWDAAAKAAAAPRDIDWGNPKHTVTLDLDLTNAVVKHNGETKSDGATILVEEYSMLELYVEPESNSYLLTSVTSQTTGAVVTDLQNGTYKVELTMGQSNVTLEITARTSPAIPITYGSPSHCSVPTGVTNPSSVVSGGSTTIKYECDEGYVLTTADITISGATVGTITNSGNVYTIPITHDGTSQSISIAAAASLPPLKLLRGYYIGGDSHDMTNAAVGNGSSVDVNKVVMTDYIHIAGNANSVVQSYTCVFGVNRNSQQDSVDGPPACCAFFRKQNGVFTLINAWVWTNDTSRVVSESNYSSAGKLDQIRAALQANELYVRSALYLDTINPDVLLSNCSMIWGNTTLFSASMDYTTTTDTTEFETYTK